jgi:hypothetical protein
VILCVPKNESSTVSYIFIRFYDCLYYFTLLDVCKNLVL